MKDKRFSGEDVENLTQVLKEASLILVRGLVTDGDHHKQYCMDKALRLLMSLGKETVEDLRKAGVTWDEGIAP